MSARYAHERAAALTPPPSAAELDRELRDASDHTLEYLAGAVEPRMDRAWGSLTNAERRALRAANELARRRNAAEREQVAEAERTRKQALADAAADARLEELRAPLRAAGLRGAALEAAAAAALAQEVTRVVERQYVEKRRELGTL